MITLTTSGDSVVFNFDNNGHYLQEGTIEVPKNSLSLVIDTSDMVTFKKAASNDVFVSATLAELGMTKAELETWFKENAVGGGGSIDSGAVQTMIDESISGLAESSAVTLEISEATSGKADADSLATVATSGSYDDLLDKPTIPTVPTSNTAFTNDAGYITSDAISGKADTSAVTESINAAVSGKVDTSTFDTYSGSVETALNGKQDTLSAGTGIEISGNVISATGGGGKAMSAGTNISVTTGETADTINCTLPIYFHPNNGRGDINIGTDNNVNSDYYRLVIGRRIDSVDTNNGSGSIGIGVATTNSQEKNELYGSDSIGIGRRFQITNNPYGAVAIGRSAKVSISMGLAIGCETVASGTTQTNINNQLKIDTSNQIYIKDKTNTNEICLQDYLGGGGITSGEVQTMIDSSISGKTDTSAFTAHTADTTIHVTTAQTAAWDAKQNALTIDSTVTSGSTNPVQGGAVYTQLGGLSLVKLTQSAYDALTTKDSNTLYVIVN